MKKIDFNKMLSLILVIIWMIFIFVMSSFDSVDSGEQSNFIVNIFSGLFGIKNTTLLSFIIRKMAHFTEYFILGILMKNVMDNYGKRTCFVFVICFIYAISDEMHQVFVPGRCFKILDIFIDSLGSLMGIFILKKIKK